MNPEPLNGYPPFHPYTPYSFEKSIMVFTFSGLEPCMPAPLERIKPPSLPAVRYIKPKYYGPLWKVKKFIVQVIGNQYSIDVNIP